LKLMPSQFEARLLLGEVYLALSNANAAEDQFEAALLVRSNSVVAKMGVAASQVAEGRFADALPGLLQLSRSSPNNSEVFHLLAQTYRGMSKNVEAEQAEAKAKRLEQLH